MLAWHFIHPDRRLRFKPFTDIVDGETLTAEGPLVLCENGMHASVRAIDALSFISWRSAIVCRVELGDEVEIGANKVCARTRKVLWSAPAGDVFVKFARLCADRAKSHADSAAYAAAYSASSARINREESKYLNWSLERMLNDLAPDGYKED